MSPDDPGGAHADALSDRPAPAQDIALLLQPVAFHRGPVQPAFHRLRARLQYIQAAIVPIQPPLDIHGAAIVLLDDQGLARQRLQLFIGERKTPPVRLGHVDGDRVLGARVAVDHLNGLRTEAAAQDSGSAGRQVALVHVKLIRVDRALHHRLPQPVGTGDKHHVPKTGLGVQGEHHPRGAPVGSHHLLDAGGQGNRVVIETPVSAIGDGPVVVEGGEDLFDGPQNLGDAAHVEEGLLLSGEGGVRQVFGCCGGAYRHGRFTTRLTDQCFIGAHQRLFQGFRKRRVQEPLTDIAADPGQGFHVIHVQSRQQGLDLPLQPVMLDEGTKGVRGGGEAAGYIQPRGVQISDHFPE